MASTMAITRIRHQGYLFFALIRHGGVTTKSLTKTLMTKDVQVNNITVDWSNSAFVLVFFTADFDIPEYKLQTALEHGGRRSSTLLEGEARCHITPGSSGHTYTALREACKFPAALQAAMMG